MWPCPGEGSPGEVNIAQFEDCSTAPRTRLLIPTRPNTYDHRHWKTRDPVRSPIDKPATARLVVGSVTTSESLVFVCLFALSPWPCVVQTPIPTQVPFLQNLRV